MVRSDQFWFIQTWYVLLFWAVLGFSHLFWPVLACSGLLWPDLTYSGLFWPVLPYGMLWPGWWQQASYNCWFALPIFSLALLAMFAAKENAKSANHRLIQFGPNWRYRLTPPRLWSVLAGLGKIWAVLTYPVFSCPVPINAFDNLHTIVTDRRIEC